MQYYSNMLMDSMTDLLWIVWWSVFDFLTLWFVNLGNGNFYWIVEIGSVGGIRAIEYFEVK